VNDPSEEVSATFGQSRSTKSFKFTYDPHNVESGSSTHYQSALESAINAIAGQVSTGSADPDLAAAITRVTVGTHIMTTSRATSTVQGVEIAGTTLSQGGPPLITGRTTIGMDIPRLRIVTSFLMLPVPTFQSRLGVANTVLTHEEAAYTVASFQGSNTVLVDKTVTVLLVGLQPLLTVMRLAQFSGGIVIGASTVSLEPSGSGPTTGFSMELKIGGQTYKAVQDPSANNDVILDGTVTLKPGSTAQPFEAQPFRLQSNVLEIDGSSLAALASASEPNIVSTLIVADHGTFTVVWCISESKDVIVDGTAT